MTAAGPGAGRHRNTPGPGVTATARAHVRAPASRTCRDETIGAVKGCIGDEAAALVAAPHTLGRATVAVDRAPAAWRDDPRLQRGRTVSRAERHRLDHPGLARASSGRVTARELVRVPGGPADATREPAVRTASEVVAAVDVAVLEARRRLDRG